MTDGIYFIDGHRRVWDGEAAPQREYAVQRVFEDIPPMPRGWGQTQWEKSILLARIRDAQRGREEGSLRPFTVPGWWTGSTSRRKPDVLLTVDKSTLTFYLNGQEVFRVTPDRRLVVAADVDMDAAAAAFVEAVNGWLHSTARQMEGA